VSLTRNRIGRTTTCLHILQRPKLQSIFEVNATSRIDLLVSPCVPYGSAVQLLPWFVECWISLEDSCGKRHSRADLPATYWDFSFQRSTFLLSAFCVLNACSSNLASLWIHFWYSQTKYCIQQLFILWLWTPRTAEKRYSSHHPRESSQWFQEPNLVGNLPLEVGQLCTTFAPVVVYIFSQNSFRSCVSAISLHVHLISWQGFLLHEFYCKLF